MILVCCILHATSQGRTDQACIGISHTYGGVLSALSIDYSLEPVKGGGWKEQEVVKALYAEQDDELLVHATRDLAADAIL